MSALWITIDFLIALILVCSAKNKMLGAYRLFYAYLGFVLATDFLCMALALTSGKSSSYYYYAYTVPTFLMPLLQIWILWDIYRRIIGYAKTSWRNSFRLAIIAGVLTAPVGWGALVAWGALSLKGGSLFYLYHTLTLFLQMALCLLVCQKAVYSREKIDLGKNLKGILSGLSLMVGCQAINFMTFIFAQSSPQFFRFFVQFIYLVALIVFTHTLWDYRPIAYLDPSYQHRMEAANRRLYEVLKAVLLNRR